MIAAVATSSAAASSAAAISATAYPSATSSIVTVKPIGSTVAERLSVKPSFALARAPSVPIDVPIDIKWPNCPIDGVPIDICLNYR